MLYCLMLARWKTRGRGPGVRGPGVRGPGVRGTGSRDVENAGYHFFCQDMNFPQ